MSNTTKGWLIEKWHALFGKQSEVERQVHRLQRQGIHIVRLAHAASMVMLVLVSTATLFTLGGTTAQVVIQSFQSGHPDWSRLVLVSILFFMVLCADIGMIYGATTLRILLSRNAKSKTIAIHIIAVLLVALLEAVTYWNMIVTYEHPTGQLEHVLAFGRAFLTPALAIYLSLATAVGVTKGDFLNIAALSSGIVGIQKLSDLTGREDTGLDRVWQVFDAASGPSSQDHQVHKLIMVVSGEPVKLLEPPRTVVEPTDVTYTSGSGSKTPSRQFPIKMAQKPTDSVKTINRTPSKSEATPAVSELDLQRIQLALATRPQPGAGRIARELSLPVGTVARAVGQLQSRQATVSL